tara:strand:- start:338 stop:553 length:216 start_codon:yes stop_codon:yes gene_type:complete
MDELIEALTILRKYGNPRNPTLCEHDTLYINDEISSNDVSSEDKERLEELGFKSKNEYGDAQFVSYRFGSA